jgi:protein-S-isoprenylcysteine O-methyltransferase Ste14
VLIIVSLFWLGSEIVLSRTKHSQSTDRHNDNSSLRILWITITVCVTVGIVLRFRQTGNFGGDPLFYQIAGIMLIIFGLIVRWVAIFSLKQHFTVDVAVTKDHRIINAGIYRFVRHPSYSGSLLSFYGLGLFTAHYFNFLIIVLPVTAAFLYRIHVEEKMLVGTFGDEYIRYSKSVKRLIPGIY